ncbi:hypothetical protein WJX81_005660 [Elliptochloris bilobata]|uniref:Uncharacterized protein n=1 Tax=Elliptochloris bilobata TaxID=381761 RepID=A0AAW1RSY5_9CHLO
MFELGRFHEVLPVLQQQYGGLYNIRCDILLLWVALGLDAKLHEAGPVLEEYIQESSVLDAAAEASPSADRLVLTPQEYTAAVRMYAVEVLAREGGQPERALEWALSSACHVPEGERAGLLGELQMAAAADARTLAPRTPPAPHGKASPSTNGTGGGGGEPEIVPAAEPGADQGSRSRSAALHGAKTTAGNGDGVGGGDAGSAEAAGAWLRSAAKRAAELWHDDQALAEWGLTPAQLAGAVGCSALVVYALLAERRALARALRRAASGVSASVTELGRLALSLSPNPIAAAAAGRPASLLR